jgi:hypothetical protein
MKKTHLLLCLLLCTIGMLSAQTPGIQWAKNIVNPGSPAEFNGESIDLWVDNSGNAYLLVSSLLPLSLEGGQKVDLPQGKEGYFLLKYTPNGTVAWVRTFVLDEIEYDAKVHGDALGNVYVGGSFIDSVNIDTGAKLKVSCAFGCSEIFVAKFDTNGKSLWIKGIQSDNTQFKRLGGLACDSQNNLYISGEYDGTSITFEGGFKYENLPDTRFFLVKSIPDWKPIWLKTLSNQGGEANNRLLCISPNDDIYVSGNYSTSRIQFTDNIGLSSFGNDNFYLANYDKDGNVKWAKNVNSKSYIDILDMDADAKGNVYLACDFSEDILEGNNAIVKGLSNYSSALLRVNASKINAPFSLDYVNEDGYPLITCAVQPQGDFFTGGFFGDNKLTIGTKSISNSGCLDIALIQGKDDALKNAISIGGNGCEGISNFNYGSGIDFDPAGNLYINAIYQGGAKLGAFSYQQSGLAMVKVSTTLVSTHSPAADELLRIQPNPTSGLVQITFPDADPAGWLILFDNQGREVHRERAVSNIQTLQLNLANGIYWLQWQNGTRTDYQKLVIQK